MRLPHLSAVVALLTGVLLVAIYWPGLHGGFFFDDGPSILQTEGVRLEKFSFETLRQVFASGHSGPSGRPLAQLSFALNHYFSGFSPFAFKATNLAIHAANALLIYLLALRLHSGTASQAKRQRALIAATVLAIAWLLHPIQLTSVLHVVQRMTSLSAFFLLAALLLHIHARTQTGRTPLVTLIVAWGLFWPLSILCKETGALFPFFALAWELIVRRSGVGGLDRFARALALSTALILLAASAYALSPGGQWLWAGYGLRAFTLAERLMTEARVLWFYLELILLPRLNTLGLYHDDIALSTSLFTPWSTLPSIAGLIGLGYLVWRTKSSAPIFSFGIAWFLIGHGLESTALPLEIAHEHRNYLPLFGILLAGGWLLSSATQRQGAVKSISVALAILLLANLPFVTALRAHQFGEEVRRSLAEAQNHPDSARAQHEAGRILAELYEAATAYSPTHTQAQEHFQRACKLDPDAKMCWLGLIHLNCKAGKLAEPPWVIELGRRLRETPFGPGDQTVLHSVKEMAINGSLCLDRADINGVFTAALANPSVSPGIQAMLHSWHADYLWLHEHDMAAARTAVGRSLALNPASPSNRFKWAQLIFISGEREQARQLLLKLRAENISANERKTLNELLATYNIGAH